MAFKDCDDHVSGAMFVSLSNDKDKEVMTFVGEPIPRQEKYMGKPRYRFYFPVVTYSGLQVWGVGSRDYVQIRDNWQAFRNKTYLVTRKGKSGDPKTTYSKVATKQTKALAAAVKAVKPADVQALLQQVAEFSPNVGPNDEPPI